MKARRRWRLAAMMALTYSVQGSFWPLLAIHLADLGISSRDRGWIFATLAIGSTSAPLWAGQLVDRAIATQHALALIYAVGTGLLALLASGWIGSAGGLFLVFLAYWAVTAPTYGLSNSLAMRNLADPGREFGRVRLWGTAGWMAAGWVVSMVMAASGTARSGHGAYEALWVAAGFSAMASLYCLTLPDTPPLAVGPRGDRAMAAGLELARRPDLARFLMVAFGVYLTLPVVYQVVPVYLEASGLPRAWVTSAMTLSQTSEILLLAALPWLLHRFGVKLTLAIGIAAWFTWFSGLTSRPALGWAVAGLLLHGVGVACFNVGGQLFLDARAPRHLRATAQSILLMATSGLGSLLGNLLVGELVGRTHPRDVLVFLFPCIINGALLLYLLRGFREPASGVAWAGAPNDEHLSRSPTGRGPVARVGHLVTESADG